MSSSKGGGNVGSSGPSSKGKGGGGGAYVSNPGVSEMNMNSAQDEGWEVYGKKSKNKGAGSNAPKQWGPHCSTSKTWGQPDTLQKLGMKSHGGSGRGSGQTCPAMPSVRGYTKPQSSNQSAESGYVGPSAPIPPPLKTSQSSEESLGRKEDVPLQVDEDDDEESDGLDDSDDELTSDGFDSDESQKSHETRKKNRWFKNTFHLIDGLTVEQINEPEREWHCPACKGAGATYWYRGLQPLITHAKTKTKNVKSHRKLAKLLDEELRRRGTSAGTAGEIFGKWKGLEEIADKDIIWPPMVMVMNTKLEKDEKEMWSGMGNPELLNYFSSYPAVKARHSYGPQGHRGISVLIFESSAVGYAEAERLSKHFEDTFRDRLAWKRNRVAFYPGGQRQLYGYMAERQDLDAFNQHSQGKTNSKVKYEMRSYREMVVNQMKQMSEDNQQLQWLKDKVSKEQKSKKALEESYGLVTEKLRKTMEENRVVKLRTKKHHEQNKEEMDFQEQFFRNQIQPFYDARNAKEENFEKIQQYEHEKVAQSEANVSFGAERRAEVIAKFSQLQGKELEEFGNERDKLVKAHEARMMALQKEFDEAFNKLMEKYIPSGSKVN